MSFVSYAQNFEDVMLWRALKHVEIGFYIDVGAQDPDVDSVTKAFYERGWRGINVEPISQWFERLQEKRPRDINLQLAVGSAIGNQVFYELPDTGLSTSDKTTAERHETERGYTKIERMVPIETLTSICQRFHMAPIHFLKIDAEGMEKEVLAGIDFSAIRPWIVFVEATLPNSQVEDYEGWDSIITAACYDYVYFDGLNRFYVAHEHRELKKHFRVPPNIFDSFISIQQHTSEASAEQANARAAQSEAEAQQANARAAQSEAEAQQANARERESNSMLSAVFNSNSWRMTLPIRFLLDLLKKSTSRLMAILNKYFLSFLMELHRDFKRIIKPIIRLVVCYAKQNTSLKKIGLRLIKPFPGLKNRLKILSTATLKNSAQVQALQKEDLVDSNMIQKSLTKSQSERIYYYYVDFTVRSPANSGIERTTRMLARSLLQMGEQVRFVKWCDERKTLVYINRAEQLHLAKWNGPILNIEESAYYPDKEDAGDAVAVSIIGNNWLIIPEVPYVTFHATPPKTLQIIKEALSLGLKTAFIFYDMIPMHREELKKDVPKHAEYVRQLCSADVVFTISEHSYQDLITFIKNDRSIVTADLTRFQPLPLPAESMLGPRVNNTRVAMQSKPIILCVGSITPHKNQLSLVRAFNAYCRKNPRTDWKLFLVGNIDELVKVELASLVKNNERIQCVGHLTDESLHTLYSSCSFTVFPSVEEGFGLPIVESLWFGKPCVCANFGAMAETGSLPGCISIDTRKEVAIEQVLTDLIKNPSRIEQLCHATVTARLETWQQYAGRLIAVLNERDEIHSGRTLWIDVSELARHDVGSGIQRVTRTLANFLLCQPPDGYVVRLVRLLSGCSYYVSANVLEAKFLGYPPDVDSTEPLDFKHGDIFFGLDLVPQLMNAAVWLQDQRNKGVRCVFLVYDLIPVTHSEFYPSFSNAWFTEWLNIIVKQSDGLLCISQETANQLNAWIERNPSKTEWIPTISWIHLGADFEYNHPQLDIPSNAEFVLKSLSGKLNFLMVGTIEPRKGHAQVIEAFEELWDRDVCVNLLIVGKEGWNGSNEVTGESLACKLKNHPQLGKKLFWFGAISDEYLDKIYCVSSVLIAASYTEGFGLPLIEASHRGINVFARDIPVFREVAGEHALYFKSQNALGLSAEIESWINAYQKNMLPVAGRIPCLTWEECANNIVSHLIKKEKI